MIWISSNLYFQFLARRLQEIKAVQVNLYHNPPANYGIITGLLMHLVRLMETTPTQIPAHVVRSLEQIKAGSIMMTHGLLFLHNLQVDSGSPTFPGLREEDGMDVRKALGLNRRSRLPRKQLAMLDPPSVAYPLGGSPTWAQLCSVMAEQPWAIMKEFAFTPQWGSNEVAAKLFISFTTQMFQFLHTSWHANGFVAPSSLEESMDMWTPTSLHQSLSDVAFQVRA